MNEIEPLQRFTITNQPAYAPPSSDFAKVPIYPPNNPGHPSDYPPR